MYINKAKTIVLKIGSSNLVDSRGKLKEKWLNSFVKDIKKFKKKGKNFVIVSSGAIALGQNSLNVKKKKLKIEMSQALASIGQIYLTNIYRKIFEKNKMVSQMFKNKALFTFFLLTVRLIVVPTGPLISLTASNKDLPCTCSFPILTM